MIKKSFESVYNAFNYDDGQINIAKLCLAQGENGDLISSGHCKFAVSGGGFAHLEDFGQYLLSALNDSVIVGQDFTSSLSHTRDQFSLTDVATIRIPASTNDEYYAYDFNLLTLTNTMIKLLWVLSTHSIQLRNLEPLFTEQFSQSILNNCLDTENVTYAEGACYINIWANNMKEKIDFGHMLYAMFNEMLIDQRFVLPDIIYNNNHIVL